MLKGFKDFLMRGNVVDLAVAVVIGAAFGSIVTAFTSNIINPLVALFGGNNVEGLAFKLIDANEKTKMDFGALITAVINFAIVAAVVYFVFVLPMNKLKERREKGVEPGPSEPTDVELLKEIRDLLAAGQNGQNGQPQSADVRNPKV
ncbi:large-conductance mechanosensitive channel protein MscL [Lentzea sp. PSKA42]|jgi:large conductance mechanosensitive channel|uniref:Large-conductance mechanosensitive channel n=1 Tax=Lentzea indica TaxID=2604800 RepID=A0ABX1FPG4_9PSEU|nr:large-conductance mechanosensitive channel protein MscL [Lentzea indica]NKE60893.1 large-conductance mechanosensitive channel protein MscL [Lentzea indica]